MSGYDGLVTKTARAIVDDGFLALWNGMTFESARDVMINPVFNEIFAYEYRSWIGKGTLSPVSGLEPFDKVVITNAVTHSLESYFLANRNKRIRMFRGEYPHMRRLMKLYGQPVLYLGEGEDVNPAYDVVLLSWPFSATGDKHPATDYILELCDKIGVPVFVDCAFWPACYDVPIDLGHECIRQVAFSLSKSFPMAGVRIGIEFLRYESQPHPQDVFLGHYFNRLGAAVALSIFKRFYPDYIPAKYRHTQHHVCKELGLTPSKTVIFGLSEDPEWEEYSREGVVNRPCISKAIESERGFR